MKYAMLALIFAASTAYAAQAYFTGNMHQVTTVTQQIGWECEYLYAGQKFWRTFVGLCPTVIEVQ